GRPVDTAGGSVEIRFLGPFEVVDMDRPVPLGGYKQKALLAILALQAGEVVPIRRLIDDVWPDNPPEAAHNALQADVSRPRQALRPGAPVGKGEVIRFEHGGYALDLSRDNVDAHRFAPLVAEGERTARTGDADAAADALRKALRLWRGPPLADFAHEPFAQ